MSRIDRTEEFTEPVFTRSRRTWWANMAGNVPGVNVCTEERLTVTEATRRFLDWDVNKVNLYDPETFEATEMWAHKRSDTNKILGFSTDRFVVVQNSAVDELFTEALTGINYAVASAGALKHGAVTFLSVDFDDTPSISAGGQTIEPYLSVVNAHDGHGSLKVYASGIRPECLNTIDIGWLAGVKLGRLAHTTNVMKKVPALRDEIAKYVEILPRAEQNVRRMIDTRLDRVQVRSSIEAATPIPDPVFKDGKVKNAAAITRAEARRETMMGLLTDDRVGFEGTAWGVFQALSTYAQQEKGFRRMPKSGVDSRGASTLVKHFTGEQAVDDSKLAGFALAFADRPLVRVDRAGLVAV